MTSPALPTVHILYENPDWMPPIVKALRERGFEVNAIHVEQGQIDPSRSPAPGIYWNRMSPSSHTRGHSRSVGFTRELLFWLESHQRRVINGSHALELEVSKLRQAIALHRLGISTPRTVLALGKEEMLLLAGTFEGPFITKHNQGGKGLGIRLFDTVAELQLYVESDDYDEGPNGQVILQEYILSPEPFITRAEFVGGKFLFAMRSNTESGFMLCPSDSCQATVTPADICPAGGSGTKFQPSPVTADDEVIRKLELLCQREGLEQAGIEFIEDQDGRVYVYDINGTTNYNNAFGSKIKVDGMAAMADYIDQRVVPQWRALPEPQPRLEELERGA